MFSCVPKLVLVRPFLLRKDQPICVAKILLCVNWQLLVGSQVMVVVRSWYQVIKGVVEDELVLTCTSWGKIDSNRMIVVEVKLISDTTKV